MGRDRDREAGELGAPQRQGRGKKWKQRADGNVRRVIPGAPGPGVDVEHRGWHRALSGP